MYKLNEIIKEYSQSATIYELITIKEILKNVDINHKYCYFEFPKKYERSVDDRVPEDIIASINRDLCYNGSEYSNSDSGKIFNSILGSLYYKLDEIIQNKPLECSISILSILEINRYFAQAVTVWSRQYHIEKTENNTLNAILTILNSREYKDNSEVYLFFDKYFARDKNALEIIFPYIYQKIALQVPSVTTLDICSIKIDLLLKLANAILQVTNLIDEYRRGDYKNCILQIDENGYIKYIDTNKNQEKYFNHILQKGDFYFSKHGNQFDKILESLIGLSQDNVNKIFSLGNTEGLCNDEFLIGNVTDLTKRISLVSGINEYSVEKLLAYMTYYLPEQHFDGKTHFEQKITRKCFVSINNILITPLGLFKTSVVNNYLDAIHRQIEDEKIKKHFYKIWSLMDKEFEDFIFQKCRDNLHCTFIDHSIQQKDIRIDSKCVELSGEVDVMLLYKSTVFIIECKNTGLRTTFDKINSIKQDFEFGNKKSSFQAKLAKKIDIIQSNIETVKKFMHTDIDVKRVTGCIVTSDYYLGSNECNGNSYNVLVWSELISWIENY